MIIFEVEKCDYYKYCSSYTDSFKIEKNYFTKQKRTD